MSDTATDFNGLPDAGAVQAADVLALQRGTGAASTKRTTAEAVATHTLEGITAGSGIRKSQTGAAATLESGGAASVEITGASATLSLTHANRFIRCNNATAQTITIPPQASVTWPDDIQLEGVQWGAGAVTFVAGSGVTLRKRSNRTATTGGQYAAWGLKRISTNEWWLFGDLGSA